MKIYSFDISYDSRFNPLETGVLMTTNFILSFADDNTISNEEPNTKWDFYEVLMGMRIQNNWR